MTKKIDSQHYKLIYGDIKQAGIKITMPRRLTPSAKRKLTNIYNQHAALIAHSHKYIFSNKINKLQADKIKKDKGQNLYNVVPAGKGKYKVYTRGRLGEKLEVRDTLGKVFGKNKRIKRVTVSHKGSSISGKKDTKYNFYSPKQKNLYLNHLMDSAEEIIKSGHAIQVHVNGGTWSYIYGTADQLIGYLSQIPNNLNLIANIELMPVPFINPPEKARNKKRAAQGNKSFKRKKFDA